MGKMSPAAHFQHCPAPSQLCCLEEHKKQKGHGRGTTGPASNLNPLHLFPASPKPGV